ncbi:glycerol-3-phosphate 1-O-acyltransferase PlsY [Paenibacillus pasadenensis]|uniref:glycerol-3-phosphate 1-O-acyltransferase PlsY n=1 Tax=Paenibacillus pasadenensis TaxID=217090 RepID=UPI00203E2B23|nr:glycerol-3-phosphate 1-O-acyltransferase PlsY [Paenibacillus pasadenensis]MCM3747387.1 glycerol-3-phosphate 1-O-acyltransferase PlsY [Paenibacillus pasadenensis]
MLTSILAIAASYLLGSVSFSILIARYVKGIDIRQYGSGNAGATNTLRVLGKGPGITVFVLDILKGVAAVWIGKLANSDIDWLPALCGLAVIIGHNWPVYFRFKGGKGIATAIGVMISLAFLPSLYAGIVAILLIVLTRYVSLGSLAFALLTPLFILLLIGLGPVFWMSAVLCVFAFIRHRTNLVKLIKGTENKLGAKKE